MLMHVFSVDNVDNVSDASVTIQTPSDRDPAYEAWVDDVARNSAALDDAELELLAAAAEADGVDLGSFGPPLDCSALDAHVRSFPAGHGWLPQIGFNWRSNRWEAEVRRGTPDGPDRLPCGEHVDQAEAWRACGDAVRRMLAARASGDAAEIAAVTSLIIHATPNVPRPMGRHGSCHGQI